MKLTAFSQVLYKQNVIVNYSRIKISLLPCLLFIIILTYACSSSKTSINNSTIEKKYASALKNLQKGKSINKNQVLLITSINEIFRSQSIIRDSLMGLKQLENKEKVFQINDHLYSIIEESSQFTNGQYDDKKRQIKSQNNALKPHLKDSYYSIGSTAMEEAKKKRNKSLYKKAFTALKKSKEYGNTEIESMIKESENLSHTVYIVNAKSTEDNTYKVSIDNQFKELERLELLFTKIKYNELEDPMCDCKIDVLFNQLMVSDDETSNTENFQKQVKEQEQGADGTAIVRTRTIRASVTKNVKKRILDWNILIKGSSETNDCKMTDKGYTENLVSQSIGLRVSGDPRAIPEKYKNVFEEPLLSKREMIDEAIAKVYTYLESELKRSN